MTEDEKADFTGWAILEIMGNRRLGGMVSVQEIAGHNFIRIDIPATGIGNSDDNPGVTQFYGPQSVYCLTPCSEHIARSIAEISPKPATRWEIEAIAARSSSPQRQEFDDVPF